MISVHVHGTEAPIRSEGLSKMGELIELIERIGNRILKLGLVGCSFMDQWKLNKLMNKAECFSTLPVKYFKDPEDAKTWLVTELG